MIWLKILILGLCATMSLTKRQEVEEVTKRQLDTLIKSEDYLAVFWYGKNCKTCDRILAVLETKTVELDDAGIKVVRINDKKSAKSFGILSSPGLTYFKGGKGDNFEGELTDGEQLMDYLASPEAMELPDQIEEVNAKQLDTLVQEKMFVAVLFYNKQEESSAALAELENIDSQADKVGIAFVKINDLELVSEFGLGNLPKLVYYRHTTPIVYDGDVTDEAKVLDWLINNRGTGDDSERLEEVTSQNLEAMTSTSEGMVVLFYDTDSRKAENLLEVMEQIDDDVAKHGIQFVKCSEEGAAEQYGVARLPSLVFFKNDLPSLYEGNLFDDTKALEWILNQEENASIEELTSPMIEKLIREAKNVVVVFCKYAGYMLIAVTHTCYMLRHYTGATTATSVVNRRIQGDPKQNGTFENQQQYLNINGGGGDLLNTNPNNNIMPINGDLWVTEQRPETYLPPERVKGLAMES